ncbi:bifunctional diguanylate cyclase/phosphodiesterase [Shewanella sp. cp20]|uniref:bifunctional diguanylate cyclase/phosphodiesterase n=1 Tax=Shewanella sp. cp20 TaxID=1521167 RepID=UPI0005A08511|nr:GGDEF domain-containing protein [Shewanella sp. cp20]KIO36812.1 diguanylate cyclase [Shewanella sp. cp20]
MKPYQDALSLLEQDPLFSQTQVNTAQLAVPEEMFNGWQQTLDLLSEIVDTPAILIMRVTEKDISVFTTSHHPDNPYKRHDTESLGHGLYCETVIQRQAELVVPNALKDKDWDHNPDIKLGMIAYCGLPLTWPNGQPFGTLCMLDNKERDYGRTFRHLLARFQNAINANLASLYQSAKLFHLNQILETKVQERTQELTRLNKKLLSEIEQRTSIENSLQFHKDHDPLTGLANRLGFVNQLSQQLSQPDDLSTYVIYFGLRNFKSINESYGYVVGDKVLQLFSQRIKRILDKETLLARIAGAEFVIAHRGKNPLELPLIDSIIQTANIPFALAEFSIKIPCCIGVAVAPTDAQEASELMQKAGAAMSISKAEGTPYSFFNKSTQTNIERRCLLESHLVDALKHQELSLHYQPLFSLQHKRVIGAEALLRWHSPQLGNVPPDQFISLAEHNGQIIAIGNFVLHTAIEQAAKWLSQDPNRRFRVAINISPLQFRDTDFADYIANLLSLYRLPASCLELEITEGVLLQDEQLAQHIIGRLQALGVRISLDDFGTGYSSLSYLQKYSFDTLKIDRCFITNLEKNEQDRELTRAIIAMGKKLTLNVIAEGVETQAQDAFIRQEECDFGQGYLYGRPVDAQSFEHDYLSADNE